MFKKKLAQGALISLLIGGCSVKDILKESSSDKPVVLFILDTSESMLNLEEGKSKMENAKKSIVDTVSKMDSDRFNTGLITFDNTRRCRAKTAVELGDPTNILNSIDEVEAWGVSPLADAIARSNKMLSGTEKKMLILLSDGKDNCGGDPVAEAEKLYKKYGVKVNLQVIGYAVEKKKQEELRKIATISKDWMYHDTKNGKSAKKIVEKIVQKIMPEKAKATVPEKAEIRTPQPVEQVTSTVEVENTESNVVEEESVESSSIEASNFNFQFDTGSNRLDNSYVEKVEELNSYLQNSDRQILIIGHADSRGTESFNQKLSVRRAKAVKSKLIKLGIDSSKIKVIGRGEMNPISSNDTEDGRRQNRRVEIQIMD